MWNESLHIVGEPSALSFNKQCFIQEYAKSLVNASLSILYIVITQSYYFMYNL